MIDFGYASSYLLGIWMIGGISKRSETPHLTSTAFVFAEGDEPGTKWWIRIQKRYSNTEEPFNSQDIVSRLSLLAEGRQYEVRTYVTERMDAMAALEYEEIQVKDFVPVYEQAGEWMDKALRLKRLPSWMHVKRVTEGSPEFEFLEKEHALSRKG